MTATPADEPSTGRGREGVDARAGACDARALAGWGLVVSRIQVAPVIQRQSELGSERLPERILRNPRIAVANPLRIVAFQQLQCLNSTNVVLAVRDEVNVVAVLGEQAYGGLEVPEEPEATERKQNFHRGR
jgi:hypothetical protein